MCGIYDALKFRGCVQSILSTRVIACTYPVVIVTDKNQPEYMYTL